jgi:hypothetical protein
VKAHPMLCGKSVGPDAVSSPEMSPGLYHEGAAMEYGTIPGVPKRVSRVVRKLPAPCHLPSPSPSFSCVLSLFCSIHFHDGAAAASRTGHSADRSCGGMRACVRVLQIYGTLFLNKADQPFELLDAVWASGCNTFDCAKVCVCVWGGRGGPRSGRALVTAGVYVCVCVRVRVCVVARAGGWFNLRRVTLTPLHPSSFASRVNTENIVWA